MNPNYKRTRLACYSAYFTMSSIFILPPLLFATLQDTYGISYTLLGTLVLTNFCTQMLVDLLFSLFAKKFNAKLLVRVTPLITSLGLTIYALAPWLLPQQFAYPGLLLGTIVFSIASGLSEVMLSPTIAALPSDNPQRDMSMLHSLYAFGIFFVIVVSTVFFALFGSQNWMYLTLFFAALPVIAAVLFMVAYNMSEWRHFLGICKKSPAKDIVVLSLTFILTVIFNLIVAIAVGLVLSAVLNRGLHRTEDSENT